MHIIEHIHPLLDSENITILTKFSYYIELYSIRYFYSFMGIASSYILVNLLIKQSKLIDHHSLFTISNLCFGIYLFQQFILKILYYQTPFPEILGPILLPWVGFIVALLFSVLFTLGVKKIKILQNFI